MLTNDEDRERKAEHKRPGTYHVVINPDSFSSLEEYRDNHNDEPPCRKPSRSTRAHRRNSFYASDSETRQDVYEDPDTLILGNFEEIVRKLPTLGLLTTQFEDSRSSSLASHSPATSYVLSAHPSDPSMGLDTVWEVGEDQNIASFYGTFVRSQLHQVHRDSLGTFAQTGIQTIPDVLDEQATRFTPVCMARLYHLSRSSFLNLGFPLQHVYLLASIHARALKNSRADYKSYSSIMP